MTNDEQTFVKFDKALATGGVAGGVATGETVFPALLPFSIDVACLSIFWSPGFSHQRLAAFSQPAIGRVNKAVPSTCLPWRPRAYSAKQGVVQRSKSTSIFRHLRLNRFPSLLPPNSFPPARAVSVAVPAYPGRSQISSHFIPLLSRPTAASCLFVSARVGVTTRRDDRRAG